MTDKELKQIIVNIKGADKKAMAEAKAYADSLAAPPGSLGKLTDTAVRLSGITGKLKNSMDYERIVVLCADNGVIEENVSSAPKSVTISQAINMTKHLTGMSALANYFGCDVEVVDMGIDADYNCPEIEDRRIRKGTGNIVKEAAMTREEALTAIATGISLAEKAAKDGVDIIGVGEMGIGNTTTSSAVLAALTGCGAEEVTGRGGGITDESFAKKKAVITAALKKHAPDPKDPVDVLSKVGGLDIAAMCGVYLGAAKVRIPVVIDGFISIVAALSAVRLCPAVRDFIFPSHVSEERGYLIAAKELELDPWLTLSMRLGEGSGCPLAFQVVDAACALMSDMATFEKAAINDDYLTEIRKL